MVPQYYEFRNVYNSGISPSTVHCKNTALSWYFKRYLLQKLMSVFEFEGIPENWDIDYFKYNLFVFGRVAVIYTKEFGTIPQYCTLYGYDVYYRPNRVQIANPLLKNMTGTDLIIGYNTEVVRMQPDYGGAWDIVSYYAELMALSSEALAVNLLNSKLAYVFAAENKKMAETFKKLFDKIASGEPAAVIDKELYNEDGRLAMELFNQNLANTYIAGDILEDMAKIDSRFNTEIGIPNVNIAKTSGVSDSEIRANDIDTESKARLWEEIINRSLDKVNKMFNKNISCKLRFEKLLEGGGDNAEKAVALNNGAI